MTKCIELHVNGFDVRADSADDEPRLRDVDIAERAGMAQPRNVRAVIKKAAKSGLLRAEDMRTQTVRMQIPKPRGGFESRTVTEFWLTQTGASLLLTQLRTPAAIAFTRQLVETCREAVRLLRENGTHTFRVDASLESSPVLGDHWDKRQKLGQLCKAVADFQRCSVAAVHGWVRAQYKRPSVYQISVLLWRDVQDVLNSALHGLVPLLPPVRRRALPAAPSQLAMFG